MYESLRMMLQKCKLSAEKQRDLVAGPETQDQAAPGHPQTVLSTAGKYVMQENTIGVPGESCHMSPDSHVTGVCPVCSIHSDSLTGTLNSSPLEYDLFLNGCIWKPPCKTRTSQWSQGLRLPQSFFGRYNSITLRSGLDNSPATDEDACKCRHFRAAQVTGPGLKRILSVIKVPNTKNHSPRLLQQRTVFRCQRRVPLTAMSAGQPTKNHQSLQGRCHCVDLAFCHSHGR